MCLRQTHNHIFSKQYLHNSYSHTIEIIDRKMINFLPHTTPLILFIQSQKVTLTHCCCLILIHTLCILTHLYYWNFYLFIYCFFSFLFVCFGTIHFYYLEGMKSDCAALKCYYLCTNKTLN